MPTFKCPVPDCSHSRTRKSDILQHIRDRHAGVVLSSSELQSLQAAHCTNCGEVVSALSRRHDCTRALQRRAAPQATLGIENILVPPPLDLPQPTAHAVLGEQPPQHIAHESMHGNETPSFNRPSQSVPFEAREQWTRTVTRSLEELIAAIGRGTEQGIADSFRQLLGLPSQALVDTGASKGRSRRTRARLQRIESGMDVYASRQPRNRAANDPKYKLASRMHRLLTLGSVTRAAKCLEALPLAQPTAHTMAALQALHPSAPPPPAPATTTAPVHVSLEVFRDVLRQLPKGAAAGPSGWTYEHVKAATQTPDSAIGAALELINAILAGGLPHLPELLDCNLIGLEKPGGNGLRPIAIGEVWLRIASRCAMASCPGAGQALAPLQLGVGVRGGSQIIGHALNTGIATNPDYATLSMDWKNAFNELDRGEMLKAVAKRQPSMLPYAVWAYRHSSRLFVRGFPQGTPPILSERGVRQGDACAAYYFALTEQDVLEAIALTHPATSPVAYADDGYLQGSPASVIAAFPAICRLGASIGLTARLDKCGVYSPNAMVGAEVAAALGIPHRVDGLVVAGTPIGSDEFVAASANKSSQAVCKVIEDLIALPLPLQDQFIVLRMSSQMRIAHLQRVTPWRLLKDATLGLEDKASQAAFTIMQRPLDDDVKKGQLSLPLRFGGMGLRNTSELEAHAAYLSAVAVTEHAMRAGPQTYRPFSGPFAPELTHVWQAIHSEGAESGMWPPEAVIIDQKCIDELLPGVQHLYARFVAQRRHIALIESLSTDTEKDLQDLARLRSCSCRAASLWLDALPMSAHLQLSDAEFRSAMRHRLGLTHTPANAGAVQCWCGRHLEPGDTSHAMTCKSLSGAMTLRHDILKGIWRRIACRAGVATSLEPVLRPLQGSQSAAIANRPESRGDILLALQDALTVVDVSVVHPAASTYVNAAARAEGSAAAVRDHAKRAQYENSDPLGYAFVPLSTETFGRLGKPAMALLNKLAECASASGVVFKDGFVVNALRELSVGLCRGNCVLYKRSLYALARVSGTAFRAGADIPTSEII